MTLIPTTLQRPSQGLHRRDFIRHGIVLGAATQVVGLPALSGATGDQILIGQIGTKHAHASGKMASMRKLNSLFNVVGIVEPDDRRWASVKDEGAYRGLRRLTEAQLQSTPGLRAVAVETDVPDLVPTAGRCLRAGKHVHLDKPAGESLDAFEQICALADREGLTIQMGYMFRYNPGFQLVYKAVREGWLGEITEVNGMIGKRASSGLRDELARYPGSGMFELACHLIDSLVTVLGEPQAVHAYGRRTQPERDRVWDNQLAVFEYPKALATIRCNHADPIGFARRRFNVTGTEGTIELNPLEPPRVKLALARAAGGFDAGVHEVALVASKGRYDGEFRDLARIIRGEKALAWDRAHDLAVHRTVLKAGRVSDDG